MLTEELIATHERLRACESAPSLLAAATTEFGRLCDFERVVIALVEDDRLCAPLQATPANPASDNLQRLLTDAPVALRRGTEEEAVIMGAAPDVAAALPSDLAARLGLGDHVYLPVAPDGRPLALVILDRSDEPVTGADVTRARTGVFLLELAVDRLALLRRAAELARELAQFADLARDLSRDLVDAPVALPADRGLGPALPRVARRVTDDPRFALLSARERRIIQLLAEGRSNREIGEALILSPETVKTHVGRILRKTGASNRVEAVAMLVRSATD